MNSDLIMIALGVTFAVALIAVFMPSVADSGRSAKRRRMISASNPDKAGSARKVRGKEERRKMVADALKFQDEKQKGRTKNVPLRKQLLHAGWNLDVKAFWLLSALIGLVVGALVFVAGLSPIMAIGPALCSAYLIPRFLLNRSKKKREKMFLLEFPNAIDTIVRGIRSGLPLNDSIQVVAQDAKEPVCSEFKLVLEEQRLGQTSAEAVEKMFDRMPIAEVNFFSVVISVQQKSGGNLAEALSNLSSVLRNRKRMREKIKAMASEARSSAMIIGALPLCVMALLSVTSPDYLVPLFTTTPGHIALGIAIVMMSLGLFIMNKMVNFDF